MVQCWSEDPENSPLDPRTLVRDSQMDAWEVTGNNGLDSQTFDHFDHDSPGVRGLDTENGEEDTVNPLQSQDVDQGDHNQDHQN